ncbi:MULTISPECIES: CDP-glycerol glycerophosphotransferase family protein [Bacillus]|uniref:CDP-glycerol glycerophosphotransferase family protein n=1 Tax=Bacillus TaxID=1386 RepID=UPI00098BB9F8|nr:CDP-glycerol glycerophosphotransferase family protein [Bacillus sonorensis]
MNIRSLLVVLYSAGLSVTGFILRWIKPRKRVVFLVSFQDNARALLKEYERKTNRPFEVCVLYTRHAASLAKEFPAVKSKWLSETNPFHIIQAVYHMFRSECVITDNYFLITSVLNNRPQTKCIQVWHANGALKKFGLEDVANKHRTAADIKRFKKVYRSFDYIAVGSDKMAEIFKRSFGAKEEKFLRTGVPLTDQYFDSEPKASFVQTKKVILYAPTYRDYDMASLNLPFTKEQLLKDLNGEYELWVKLHPAVRKRIELDESDGCFKDVSEHPLQDLLYACDVLVSDYSSVPFEFALLNKPMLFYTYDMAQYDENRGLIDDFERVIPGKACFKRDELLEELKQIGEQNENIQHFAAEWNSYSKGDSSRKLLDFVHQLLMQSETEKSVRRKQEKG